MKSSFQHSHGLLLSLLLLPVFILSSIRTTEARGTRFLLTDPEQGRWDGLAQVDHHSGETEVQGISWNNLMGMGLEQCSDDEDEECLKRRLISEAHLDYIYTQHQKP